MQAAGQRAAAGRRAAAAPQRPRARPRGGARAAAAAAAPAVFTYVNLELDTGPGIAVHNIMPMVRAPPGRSVRPPPRCRARGAVRALAGHTGVCIPPGLRSCARRSPSRAWRRALSTCSAGVAAAAETHARVATQRGERPGPAPRAAKGAARSTRAAALRAPRRQAHDDGGVHQRV